MERVCINDFPGDSTCRMMQVFLWNALFVCTPRFCSQTHLCRGGDAQPPCLSHCILLHLCFVTRAGMTAVLNDRVLLAMEWGEGSANWLLRTKKGCYKTFPSLEI
jgi:hypothetical protein